MLFFHGNAEDVGHNLMLLITMKETFGASVLAMEYPGYGFFKNQILEERGEMKLKKKQSASAEGIKQCAILTYLHVISPIEEMGMGYDPKNVFVFGRSMGSGPSSLLARIFKPRALILMSAYKTIKDVVSNMTGYLISRLVAVHFNNLEQMKHIKCPVLLIHGQADPLILCAHSEALYEQLSEHNPNCVLKLVPHMTHNDFDLMSDILMPIKEFIDCLE